MKATTDMLSILKHAFRVGVPLVNVSTPDQQNTILKVARAFNGDKTIVTWNIVSGFEATAPIPQDIVDDGTMGPEAAINAIRRLPDRTIVILENFDLFIESPTIRQGLALLREDGKARNKMVIMLSRFPMRLTGQLIDDVIQLEEEIPDVDELKMIVANLEQARQEAGGENPLGDKDIEHVAQLLRGVSAFAAEQIVAISSSKNGVDFNQIKRLRKQRIEAVRGLTLFEAQENFSSLGGLTGIKEYLRMLFNGRCRPNVVVWLDEIEKTGLAATNDTAGVNRDQEGTLLSYMEDADVFGVMLLGVPGTGKSALCKAIAGEYPDTTVIRLDLGAMQGSLVGQSQQNLREALSIIRSLGNQQLWIGSANSINALSGAMRSRFIDTWFYDLPPKEERKAIWDIWTAKYFGQPVDEGALPDDEGWVGRNIRRCVEKAWRFNCSIKEAARYIQPVGILEMKTIEQLRAEADKRYLDVNTGTVYQKPQVGGKRRFVE